MKRPVWAVVPAKDPTRGKSRLREVLGDDERARFARQLLEHVLTVLSDCPDIDGILVATDGDEVAELARARGAAVLRDGEGHGLAAIVDAALTDVARRGARSALVLMADLPQLGVRDVRRLLEPLATHDVVIARDRKGCHTNALAVAPPTVIGTRFGRADSFEAHCSAARQADLALAVVQDERVAFDVDSPEDLASFQASGASILP